MISEEISENQASREVLPLRIAIINDVLNVKSTRGIHPSNVILVFLGIRAITKTDLINLTDTVDTPIMALRKLEDFRNNGRD